MAFRDPALAALLHCPSCQNGFTWKERDGQGGRTPLVLNCGHKLCHECLVDTVKEQQNSGKDEVLSAEFDCFVCGQRQRTVGDLTNRSVTLSFPVDFATVGLLVAAEKFPKAGLLQFGKPSSPEAVPSQMKSKLAVSLAQKRHGQQLELADMKPACKLCSALACDWWCTKCSGSFCYSCSAAHTASCPGSEASVSPYNFQGGKMRKVAVCEEHRSQKTWFCSVHPHHAKKFYCTERVRSGKVKKSDGCRFANAKASARISIGTMMSLQRYLEEAKNFTEISIFEVQHAMSDLPKLYEKDRAGLIQFFQRVISSATFSTALLVNKQISVDGKRLFILEKLQHMLFGQLTQNKFLKQRWLHILANYSELHVDLFVEKRFTDDRLLKSGSWTADGIFRKRVKVERVRDIVWESGLPKGLQGMFSKCDHELSLTDNQLEDSLDVLVGTTEVFEQNNMVVDFTVALGDSSGDWFVKEPPLAEEDSAMRTIRQTVFHVDGLIPRSWYKEHQPLIDRHPKMCDVTYIQDCPLTIWIRIAVEKHRDLSGKLQSFCCNAAVVGEICRDEVYAVALRKDIKVVLRKNHTDHLWTRVKIVEILDNNPEMCEGFLTDYGYTGVFERAELRLIPRLYRTVPAFAHPSEVSEFVPFYKDRRHQWHPGGSTMVHKWLDHSLGLYYVILEDYRKGGRLVIDMWSSCRIPSVREFLVMCGLGQLKRISDAVEKQAATKSNDRKST